MKFPQRERLMCAAITLDEPDFHAEYDETKRVWTASWKWSGDQPTVLNPSRGQRGPGDTSEDDDVVESVPLRRSSRRKRPAPRCTLCDSQIREHI